MNKDSVKIEARPDPAGCAVVRLYSARRISETLSLMMVIILILMKCRVCFTESKSNIATRSSLAGGTRLREKGLCFPRYDKFCQEFAS